MNAKMCCKILCLVLLAMLSACGGSGGGAPAPEGPSSAAMPAVAAGGKFYIMKGGTRSQAFLKGVNMGTTKPGYWPGELAITKAEYLRWFQQIYDMGANTVRVFTAQKPAFYDALYEFNEGKTAPLYFIQGIWVDEGNVATYLDPYAADGKILKAFTADCRTLADIVHGNAVIAAQPGHAFGSYTRDVSRYLIGWIAGIEWDPVFVERTNLNHPGMPQYDGRYLKTEGANPFEVFLATVGDGLVSYEIERYGSQRPLSFVNWVTTDPITHTNEPLQFEDFVSVDTERIKAKAGFAAGLFASYNIYPYYPDMFSYQAEYVNYVDPNGRRNPYRAYLKDLMSRHTVPLLVAEFGIPSSRAKAHDNLVTGFNQGVTDETTQGTQLASMIQDIYDEGCMGGLIFCWQDEWFKRTWNSMEFDDPDMRPYWMNAQTNEQQFGLLSFDPGMAPLVRLDGFGTEWPQGAPVSTQGSRRLYLQADEKYVYFKVEDSSAALEGARVVIPIDVTPKSGAALFESFSLEKPADFAIVIDGEASRIVTHSHYDCYYFLHAELSDDIPKDPAFAEPANPYFNAIMLPTSKALFLPVDQVWVPFTAYQTGRLTNGIGDPDSLAYNSLADWYARGNTLEIRIPWQLLNFRSPPAGQVMDDFFARNGFYSMPVTSIAAGVDSGTSATESIQMGDFALRTWTMPTYHERLKRSYYVMKEKLAGMI